ncbi:MAG: cytochrome c-type biogenesis CcmF C-terminal domain-containing protein [bacterium]|nr:cytochrome c-type biogenesis CcmF C-terminal domain-containing protein [bacterium]
MIGQLLIHALFGTAVALTLTAFLAMRREQKGMPLGSPGTGLPIPRMLMTALTLGLIAAVSLLVALIIQHRFDYTYIWNYSSRELPLHLLIATFYSGQEGSFLLWTLLVAVFGTALMSYSRRHLYEAPTLFFFGLILTFLTLLLVAKNPFAYYYESFAAQGITAVDVPPNGKGLNPLLHNGWITIHPPILFTGFAAMSVSFVFAMAGLVRRDYHRWITIALPWTLLATAVLGFGIMLGGFWAYETLGWGGFWGWDPVENSSLIPWLVTVALVHTMMVQKRTHGLVKTNMVLAVTAFIMVLYSTFLTRSGILGDTSVHSFVDPGKFAFWILLLFMLTFATIGAVMILMRRSDMNINKENFKPDSREFLLGIGASLIMASALMVTLGTSWPVIMELLAQPKIALATDFYNKLHIILVPAILVVNALSLIMQWRHTPRALFIRRVRNAALISIPLAALLFIPGTPTAWALVLAAAAFFGLVVNMMMGWTIMRRSPSMAGAYVSHTGIALLMFGIIATASYSEQHHVVLTQGVPVTVDGSTLTYVNSEQVERHFGDREKYKFHIKVERGGSEATISPVMYWSDYNQRQSPFMEPGIRWGVANDLYIAPNSAGTEDIFHATTVQRSGTIATPLDSTTHITLVRFTMPMEEGPAADGRMRMGAILMANDSTEFKIVTQISQAGANMSFEPIWDTIPGTTVGIGLSNIQRNNADPTKSTGEFIFRDVTKPLTTPREQITVDFSIKPWISLVWFGVITMVLGFVFSIVRHTRLAKQQPALSEVQLAPSADIKTVEHKVTDSNPQ